MDRIRNSIECKVSGRYALFTDPLTRMGGEKFSYQIPTYQALKGILESIYWKPTFVWYVDRLRVMKKIRTQSKNVRPISYSGGNSLSIYTYLADVEYRIQAHFEWNARRGDLASDRNENKHYFIAKRMIERGGRRDIFLGTRECQGYVEPCRFDEGAGDYDSLDELPFNLMFHSFEYPEETGENAFGIRLWQPVMRGGVVDFLRPEQCTIRRELRKMRPTAIATCGTQEEGLLDGFDEEVVSLELDRGAVRNV